MSVLTSWGTAHIGAIVMTAPLSDYVSSAPFLQNLLFVQYLLCQSRYYYHYNDASDYGLFIDAWHSQNEYYVEQKYSNRSFECRFSGNFNCKLHAKLLLQHLAAGNIVVRSQQLFLNLLTAFTLWVLWYYWLALNSSVLQFCLSCGGFFKRLVDQTLCYPTIQRSILCQSNSLLPSSSLITPFFCSSFLLESGWIW